MKVRELLSDKSKWCRRSYARDAFGIAIVPESDDACSFCLLGAIQRCYPVGALDVVKRIRSQLNIDPHYTVGQWNDSRQTTFPMVKALVEELDI